MGSKLTLGNASETCRSRAPPPGGSLGLRGKAGVGQEPPQTDPDVAWYSCKLLTHVMSKLGSVPFALQLLVCNKELILSALLTDAGPPNMDTLEFPNLSVPLLLLDV